MRIQKPGKKPRLELTSQVILKCKRQYSRGMILKLINTADSYIKSQHLQQNPLKRQV